jgi:hypothetical protein
MPPSPRVSRLTLDELNFLRAQLIHFIELVEDVAHIEVDEEQDETPDICDELVRWWHGLPQEERPHANDVIWAIAAAAGDYIRHVLRVDWRIVETAAPGHKSQAAGTMALCAEEVKKDPTSLILFVTDSIAQRFASKPHGFVREYVDGVLTMDVARAHLRTEEDAGPAPLLA